MDQETLDKLYAKNDSGVVNAAIHIVDYMKNNNECITQATAATIHLYGKQGLHLLLEEKIVKKYSEQVGLIVFPHTCK